MTDQDHGKIKIKIADVMKEKQISKTKLSYLAFLQLRQLNNLINEKAARVDFDVLARICHALDCRIEDILEYIPADQEEQEENNNSEIDDFIFSKEDDNLAVNFRDQNGLSRLNIYKAEDGKAVDTKFNEIFKPEIYNIKAQYFDDDKVIFDVFKSDSTTDETTGKYSLDLKSNEMIKL